MVRRTSILIGFLLSAYAGVALAQPSVALNSEDDKVLYALGVKLMLDLAPFELSPRELALVHAGMLASLDGEYLVDPAKYQEGIDNLGHRRVQKRIETAKARGAAYLKKMAKEPGAQTSASGMVWFLKTAGNLHGLGSGSVHYVTKMLTAHNWFSFFKA